MKIEHKNECYICWSKTPVFPCITLLSLTPILFSLSNSIFLNSLTMAIPAQTSEADAWDAVLRQTKLAVETSADPYAWAFDVRSTLHSSAIAIPSVELAHRLVSHFFWDNYSAAAWKLLHTALSLDIIPPSLLIALLSAT